MVAERKKSNLTLRVFTAVPGVAFLLWLIFKGGEVGTLVIASVISIVVLYELLLMMFGLEDQKKKRFTVVTLAILSGIGVIQGVNPHLIYSLVFVSMFVIFLQVAGRFSEQDMGAHARELMFACFSVLYASLLFIWLPELRALSGGVHWVALFFLMNWSVDTGAYFAGKSLGRHKLYPAVSPKKTIEGAVGGVTLAIFAALVYRHFLFEEVSISKIISITLVVGVFAQLGDLAASLLKRAFDTKDFGTILPGHGGFLDRFDGVILASPVMYLCVVSF